MTFAMLATRAARVASSTCARSGTTICPSSFQEEPLYECFELGPPACAETFIRHNSPRSYTTSFVCRPHLGSIFRTGRRALHSSESRPDHPRRFHGGQLNCQS